MLKVLILSSQLIIQPIALTDITNTDLMFDPGAWSVSIIGAEGWFEDPEDTKPCNCVLDEND